MRSSLVECCLFFHSFHFSPWTVSAAARMRTNFMLPRPLYTSTLYAVNDRLSSQERGVDSMIYFFEFLVPFMCIVCYRNSQTPMEPVLTIESSFNGLVI